MWCTCLLSIFQCGASITEEINVILAIRFQASNWYLSFINVPLFFSTFRLPSERESMEPALVLGALAFSALMASSEIQMGHLGRVKASAWRFSSIWICGWRDERY